MPGERRVIFWAKEDAWATILTVLVFLPIWPFVDCSPVLAQRAVGCGCYCGITLPPPCSEDACKRACGWKGSPSGSGASSTSPADAAMGIMRQFIEQNEQERQRSMQENQQMMRSIDEMSRERIRLEDDMLRNAAEQARRLDDKRRDETLSTLKGIPPTDDLTLKPATDFFGIPGGPKGDLSSPIDSSGVNLRQLDPNKSITVDHKALQENRQDPQKQK